MELIQKPRRKVFTMNSYLENMRDGDIRQDQDVQRLAGQYNPTMNGELVYTVLTDDYVPPIILGQDLQYVMWIIDGLQRSTCYKLFRYGNIKISKSLRDYMVRYHKKTKGEDGKIVWEDCEFDIRGMTYDTLPVELQKKFDEFQVETVIHEGCTRERLSALVKRYNNHKAMTPDQKAFTLMPIFARKIREILENKFFANNELYTERSKINGKMERIITESIMCTYFIDEWGKVEKNYTYLNDHATKDMFDTMNANVARLQKILPKKLYSLFTLKDSFLFFATWNNFVAQGKNEKDFIKFLTAFKNGLCEKEVDGVQFYLADGARGTKDKKTIQLKMHILEELIKDYFGEVNSEEAFIAECVDMNVEEVKESMSLYKDSLEDLLENTVRIDSKLRDAANMPSLLSLMAYSYKEDSDLDGWLEDYAKKHQTYLADQKQNYLHMKNDFVNYSRAERGVAS